MKKIILISALLSLNSLALASTTYYSDGTFSTTNGNTTFFSDGSYAMRSGNTTFFSDGSSAITN